MKKLSRFALVMFLINMFIIVSCDPTEDPENTPEKPPIEDPDDGGIMRPDEPMVPVVPTNPEPEKPTNPEPEKPTNPEPEKPTNPEPEKPTNPEPEKPTNPEPEKPTNPEPEKPTNPEPEKPTNPEPEKPTNPEPVIPTDPEPEKPTNPEPVIPTDPEPEPEKPTNPVNEGQNTSYTDEVDRELFKQLKGHVDYYNKKEFFDDFLFEKYPMYLVQTDSWSFSSAGNAKKAFVINPKKVTSAMKKLGSNESMGLNVYRFDDSMNNAMNRLANGNDFFTFNYSLNNQEGYYLQVYARNITLGRNNETAVTTITHEAFHALHQKKGPLNPNWKFNFDGIQDKSSFPYTRDLVELQILVTEVLIDFPNVTDKNVLKEKLKQYVAIRSKEMELDPTSRKLIKNMSLNQERSEGAPHMIEFMGKRDYFKNNDKFFGTLYGIPMKAKDRADLKDMLNSGNFYPVGASVLYAIAKLDKERMKDYNSKTPFQMASEMLNMSDSEKEEAIEAAKLSVDWGAIQKKAADFTP